MNFSYKSVNKQKDNSIKITRYNALFLKKYTEGNKNA